MARQQGLDGWPSPPMRIQQAGRMHAHPSSPPLQALLSAPEWETARLLNIPFLNRTDGDLDSRIPDVGICAIGS